MPSDWPRPVVHFQIHAKDLAKQKSFYSEMFDWDINQAEGMPFAEVPVGKGQEDVSGTMLQTDHAATLFYIQVADLNASLQQAERLGGKIIVPATDIPNAPTFGQIEDPEGNLVGLVQM